MAADWDVYYQLYGLQLEPLSWEKPVKLHLYILTFMKCSLGKWSVLSAAPTTYFYRPEDEYLSAAS